MFNLRVGLGTIHSLDYNRSADWNPQRLKPAARVTLKAPGDPVTPACRIIALRSHNGEGFWWPYQVGDDVLIGFLGRMDSPIVLCPYWTGDRHPESADENNAIMRLHGHTLKIDKTGVSIETKDGKAVLLKDDAVSIAHPKGQTFVMDGKGNMAVSVPKDLNADVTRDMKAFVKGSVDVSAEGYVQVKGKLGVDLDTENMINLKTAGLLAGVITNATHKQCHLMATPIGASQSVKAGS